MWLVDSTVFIDWMRRGISPVLALRPFVLAGAAATCGVIRVEVVRGIVHPAARAEISALFDAMVELDITALSWRRAAELAWTLDRKGSVIPLPDIVIAGCAIHAGAAIVTSDPHFSRIPELHVLGTLPPRP